MSLNHPQNHQPTEKCEDRFHDLLKEISSTANSSSLIEDFARAFHFKTPQSYLNHRPIDSLAQEVIDTFNFVNGRSKKEIGARFYQNAEENKSYLQVNLEDQPFILSSVKEVIRKFGLESQSYLHPILQIDRGEERQILSVRPLMSPGAHESILHFTFNHTDSDLLQELLNEITISLQQAMIAVEDFFPMKQRVENIARELQIYPAKDLEEKRAIEESVDLLHWLLADNFIFLGCRSYRFNQSEGETWIQVIPESGLGVLREEQGSAFANPVALSTISEPLRKRLELRKFPVFIKGNRKSAVHRQVPMDYVELKQIDATGEVVGEHRILGLLTADALNQSCSEIPVVREKLKWLLRKSQVLEGSHEHKEILSIFNNFSRHELFANDEATLEQAVEEIREHKNLNRISIFCRSDIVGQGLSVMVILPRDSFSARVRKGFQNLLCEALGATVADYHLALSEDADARLHFYFHETSKTLSLDEIVDLEAQFVKLARTWEDEFISLIRDSFDASRGSELTQRYQSTFPNNFKGAYEPKEAFSQIEFFENFYKTQDIGVQLSEQPQNEKFETVLHILKSGDRYHLSELMPALTHLGLRVIDEATYRLEGEDFPRSHLHTFKIQSQNDRAIDKGLFSNLEQAVLSLLLDKSESDPLDGLVISAGFKIEEVELIRTYVRHYQQCGAPHSLRSIANALSQNPNLALNLIKKYFYPKFQPTPEEIRTSTQLETLVKNLYSQLDSVEDINQDRILRGLLQSMVATVRTNYFQNESNPKRIALKFDSQKLSGLEAPVPQFEIFVYSKEMEGIHLRSSRIARGGIRWSDRPDDFRAEIHGLMSTQITKNSIIVPGGAKGGFIIKKDLSNCKNVLKEVETQYRTYIQALLDLTDNRDDQKIIPPPQTLCYDEPDPYLVVAADKGTSSFSDVGNEIAIQRGFWLGDAFASGGSNGYDHKLYGITARGAWESNRHHFFELGIDVDNESFSVVGIGDMSGDVFGNGMLSSRKIRLIGAFDHRHIFLDPDPDPEISYKERERLFNLNRSSWNDYNPELLSEGGGIFDRNAKKIELSPQAQEVLNLSSKTITGEELVSTLLRLPVDLLYNGGIGTYVKASHETHADAQDEKNIPVRINASELQARVITEGGNLGLTTNARIEFSKSGGKINTDFIDNSGGVHLSDREVNIKVALALITQSGKLIPEDRCALLKSEAELLCDEVLATNKDLALTLSLEEFLASQDPTDHFSLQESLCHSRATANPKELHSSKNSSLTNRTERSTTIVRPELAHLLSLASIDLQETLVLTEIEEEFDFNSYLIDYFPQKVIQTCGDFLEDHPLKKEIIITSFVNEITLRLGITQIHRLTHELGVSFIEIARAYRVADPLLDGKTFFEEIRSCLRNSQVSSQQAYYLLNSYRQALFQSIRALLCEWPQDSSAQNWCDRTLDRLEGFLVRPLSWLKRLLLPESEEKATKLVHHLVQEGIPQSIAQESVDFQFLQVVPMILARAEETDTHPEDVAKVFFTVFQALRLDLALEKLKEIPTLSPIDLGATRAIKSELYYRIAQITAQVLRSRHFEASLDQAVGRFFYHYWPALESYLCSIEDANTGHAWNLSTFVILTERLRRLEKSPVSVPLEG